MILATFKSEGLAHNSYFIGDGEAAAIVDPSRDVSRYIELAKQHGMRITSIFETHRNEDYISGAAELRRRTAAAVYRGASPDYDVPYARLVRDGDTIAWANVSLQVMATPGHTDDSISVVLRHLSSGDTPIAVFSGDALFVGDVGRTDFYPDRAKEVAGLLFDSLQRLLALGDQTLIYPAHGAGSVCGSGILDRDFSSIGYERRHNPRLQLARDAFIEVKTAEHHYYPPYFRRMEQANQGSDPELSALPDVWPIPWANFLNCRNDGRQILDLRNDQSIAGGCLPGAIAIPLDMLPSFGGWFLNYAQPIILILPDVSCLESAITSLVRIGFDRIDGYLAGGFETWSVSGEPLSSVPGIDVHDLHDALAQSQRPHLLDVRSIDEFKKGHIEGAQHVYVGEIESNLEAIPRDKPIVTYCATGRRALVAAAALKRLGFSRVSVCWGSMTAWEAARYPIVE